MIKNLLYNVCIRNGEGMCGMEISQAKTNPPSQDSFRLADAQNAHVAEVDSGCENEYINIASSIVTTSMYCGDVLSSKSGSTKAGTIPSDIYPLHITVVA